MRCERDGFSVDAAIRKGRALPNWYEDCPELAPGDEFYLQAFQRLLTCRTAEGAIPWNLIIDYGERAGLDKRETDVLVDVIGAMEDVHREWVSENAK